jgi:CRISPR system Cascade subunit CasB
MSNDLQNNPRLAAALRDWWSGLDEDRAARAELRRAHDITAVSLTPAYQRAYRRLREAGWDVEGVSPLNDRLAAVIGLLAHVKADGDQSPAQAMSRDDSGEGRPPVSPLRFQRLLEAPDLDALFIGLRRALPLVDHQISITGLAHDVVYWGDKVKKAWAYAYVWPAKKTD